MKVRATRGFILGPGKHVRPGDVFEMEQRVAIVEGERVTIGFHLPSSYYEVLDPVGIPAPVPSDESAAREVQHREPDVRNRTPQPRKRRGKKGDAQS